MAWRKKLVSLAAALVACGGLGAAGVIASAGPAAADYGPTAQFQVEISANVHALVGNGSGGGIWVWAALSSSNNINSVDYQVTDCVHGVPGVPNGAVHNSSGTATWTDSGGTLQFQVNTGAGPVTITVPDTIGHYVFPKNIPPIFSPSPFTGLPAQVQVAP